jgi:hypothetical protein
MTWSYASTEDRARFQPIGVLVRRATMDRSCWNPSRHSDLGQFQNVPSAGGGPNLHRAFRPVIFLPADPFRPRPKRFANADRVFAYAGATIG